MPVTEAEVRTRLPRGAETVEGGIINGAIDAWAENVRLRAGEDFLESPMALQAIVLGAAADAQEVFDVDNGRPESPRATAWREQAQTYLEALDAATSSLTGEEGQVNANLVIQSIPVPPFTPGDFGLPGQEGQL